MADLLIRRKISFLNDRGWLFLVLDKKKVKGRLTVIPDRKIPIPEGEHELYVTDILGFTSPTITITASGQETHRVLIGNRLSIILIIALLLLATVFLKWFPLITLQASLATTIVVVMWILFFASYFLFLRHRLYTIKEEAALSIP
ncbi:hypothetical protein [Streptococcus dentiloxodontae]